MNRFLLMFVVLLFVQVVCFGQKSFSPSWVDTSGNKVFRSERYTDICLPSLEFYYQMSSRIVVVDYKSKTLVKTHYGVNLSPDTDTSQYIDFVSGDYLVRSYLNTTSLQVYSLVFINLKNGSIAKLIKFNEQDGKWTYSMINSILMTFRNETTTYNINEYLYKLNSFAIPLFDPTNPMGIKFINSDRQKMLIQDTCKYLISADKKYIMFQSFKGKDSCQVEVWNVATNTMDYHENYSIVASIIYRYNTNNSQTTILNGFFANVGNSIVWVYYSDDNLTAPQKYTMVAGSIPMKSLVHSISRNGKVAFISAYVNPLSSEELRMDSSYVLEFEKQKVIQLSSFNLKYNPSKPNSLALVSPLRFNQDGSKSIIIYAIREPNYVCYADMLDFRDGLSYNLDRGEMLQVAVNGNLAATTNDKYFALSGIFSNVGRRLNVYSWVDMQRICSISLEEVARGEYGTSGIISTYIWDNTVSVRSFFYRKSDGLRGYWSEDKSYFQTYLDIPTLTVTSSLTSSSGSNSDGFSHSNVSYKQIKCATEFYDLYYPNQEKTLYSTTTLQKIWYLNCSINANFYVITDSLLVYKDSSILYIRRKTGNIEKSEVYPLSFVTNFYGNFTRRIIEGWRVIDKSTLSFSPEGSSLLVGDIGSGNDVYMSDEIISPVIYYNTITGKLDTTYSLYVDNDKYTTGMRYDSKRDKYIKEFVSLFTDTNKRYSQVLDGRTGKKLFETTDIIYDLGNKETYLTSQFESYLSGKSQLLFIRRYNDPNYNVYLLDVSSYLTYKQKVDRQIVSCSRGEISKIVKYDDDSYLFYRSVYGGPNGIVATSNDFINFSITPDTVLKTIYDAKLRTWWLYENVPSELLFYNSLQNTALIVRGDSVYNFDTDKMVLLNSWRANNRTNSYGILSNTSKYLASYGSDEIWLTITDMSTLQATVVDSKSDSLLYRSSNGLLKWERNDRYVCYVGTNIGSLLLRSPLTGDTIAILDCPKGYEIRRFEISRDGTKIAAIVSQIKRLYNYISGVVLWDVSELIPKISTPTVSQSSSIVAYPNPTMSAFTVELPDDMLQADTDNDNNDVVVQITNTNGQSIVYRYPKSPVVSISTSELATGIYGIRVSVGGIHKQSMISVVR